MNTKQGLALGAGAAGVLFVWSGVNDNGVLSTLRDVIAGNRPAAGPTQAFSFGLGSGSPSGSESSSGATSTGVGGTVSANQNIARLLAAPYGWSTGTDWTDLVNLWNKESSWNTRAVNPESGATGIPQLNPNSHPVPADWDSASVQIAWGLKYIKDTYGSPANAWNHEVANGWY